MNGDLISTLLWALLTFLAMFLTVGFGYLYRKDGDKRKLVFMLSFAFASFSFLPKIQVEWETIQIMEKLYSWSSLPLLSAVLIAVLSSLLRLKDFDKSFKTFLFILATTTFMIIVPFPVEIIRSSLYRGVSVIIVVALIYSILTRRETPDFMFLLSMICFISGGLGTARNLSLEFIIFAYSFAYVFIVLVFFTSKERLGEGIASFFVLKRELNETREELRVSREQLVKAENLATIGRAATMVGHDLRNPLQSIKNATYLLSNEMTQRASTHSVSISPKAMEMLDVINDSVDYADKIVRNLKDFSTTKKPMLKKININTLVKETLSQAETPEKVELITELGHLPQIEADKDMVKRIFMNLTVNGIQAMENGGTLEVSTKNSEGFVEVSFKDDGVGVSEENIKNLFTPFFTTKAQGMGMGLAICRRFAEANGGSMSVESKKGEGSTFTLRLPIQRETGGENL
jgi:signal transduction histidine kinase